MANIHKTKKTTTGTKTIKNDPVILIELNTLVKALTTINNIVAGPTTDENIRPAVDRKRNNTNVKVRLINNVLNIGDNDLQQQQPHTHTHTHTHTHHQIP